MSGEGLPPPKTKPTRGAQSVTGCMHDSGCQDSFESAGASPPPVKGKRHPLRGAACHTNRLLLLLASRHHLVDMSANGGAIDGHLVEGENELDIAASRRNL